jgi:hypothetical protein
MDEHLVKVFEPRLASDLNLRGPETWVLVRIKKPTVAELKAHLMLCGIITSYKYSVEMMDDHGSFKEMGEDDQLVPVKGPKQRIYVKVMPEANWLSWPFRSSHAPIQGNARGPCFAVASS